jgi:predicted AlkP superfamily phosphohydrolase/phosphomutase
MFYGDFCMEKKKTVIIGIDGVPYRLMEALSDKGIMPNFKELRNEGTFCKMQSSIPELSSVSWSSIITGVNPGIHGIFGFTDFIEGTYSLHFPNFRNLKTKAFWQRDSKKYIIINVPSTYPAKEINGFLVSGFVALDLEKAVYPSKFIEPLKKLGYKIDVDAQKGHKSKPLFLKDLFETHENRIKTYRYFWDKAGIAWDVFMIVFTGSDRLGHFLWDAYEDSNHEYHSEFLRYFEIIDDEIGNINNQLREEDALIMLSDHGMESVKTNVNINRYLAEEGFCSLDNDPKKNYNNIKEGTKAFALDPARIYLNKEGRFPRGHIKKNQEARLKDELIDLFSQLKMNGSPVIKRIYDKKEIYHGPYMDNAPDLILQSNSGFNLKGSVLKKEIFDKDIFTGKHTQEDAFLYLRGDADLPDNLSVENVLNLIIGRDAN